MRQLAVVVLLTVTLIFTTSLASQACEGKKLCPAMALEHAKELKLTPKQKSELRGIKKEVVEAMKAAKEKAHKRTGEVLTPEQVKKYGEVASHGESCPMGKKHQHH